MKVYLSTAYWPNLHYFYYLLNGEHIFIERYENYQKQSYRTRSRILTANGVLDLSVPVKNQAVKELSKDIEIAYKEKWQIKHWRAITSAYKNSPYFDFFEDALKPFYFEEHQYLLEYNFKQLDCVLKLLKQKRLIGFTQGYSKRISAGDDLREKIHPKVDFRDDTTVAKLLERKYYQTFESKFDFEPNLSILDLLFNKGLETIDYLRP